MEKGHKKKKKVFSFPINYGDVIEQNKSSLIANKTQTRLFINPPLVPHFLLRACHRCFTFIL